MRERGGERDREKRKRAKECLISMFAADDVIRLCRRSTILEPAHYRQEKSICAQ